MVEIMVIAYLVLGYWAVGKTIYANKIMIGDFFSIFLRRVVFGLILGWALIPIALIRCIFHI